MCNIFVVVLGDFGRSPRMMYSTLSLLNAGYSVTVIAEGGSVPIRQLQQENAKFKIKHLAPIPKFITRLPSALSLIIKALFQSFALCYLLLATFPRPRVVLVQNPPSVPTLPVCVMCCWLRQCRLVIDWHNLGYTLMALRTGENGIITRLYRFLELQFGAMASAHMCVSKAMSAHLHHALSLPTPPQVLYDAAPVMFHKRDVHDKHHLLHKLSPLFSKPYHPNGDPLSRLYPPSSTLETPQNQLQTPWTCFQHTSSSAHQDTPHTPTTGASSQSESVPQDLSGGKFVEKQPRPAFVVSSTSWTPDEDLVMLLQAAEGYDEAIQNAVKDGGDEQQYPLIVFVVTGKGPMKAAFEQQLRTRQFKYAAFRLAWLESGDYPVLLGCADLGVCLHTSSSGIDLPMKVVDMRGSSLPACCLNYDTIDELVKPDVDGLIFNTQQQLTQQLLHIFKGFPQQPSELLMRLRSGAEAAGGCRWDRNWATVAEPLIRSQVGDLSSGKKGSIQMTKLE